MTRVVRFLPIPIPSVGLYNNLWTGGGGDGLYNNPHMCGARQQYICTRERGHHGPHAAHGDPGPESGLCELWSDLDEDLELDLGL